MALQKMNQTLNLTAAAPIAEAIDPTTIVELPPVAEAIDATEVVAALVSDAVAEAVYEEITEAAANSTAVSTVTQGAVAVAQPQQSQMISQNMSDLTFDWTSFPTISLKTEGNFVDIDGHDYGKELLCRVLGWKKRWVYRANPVTDNKMHVGFSYDETTLQTGVSVAAFCKQWEAQGKTIEKREYLEVVVQMDDPGQPFDGEYRILSVSPTSKGRFSGYIERAMSIAQAKSGVADSRLVVTKVSVGDKITKVANPFYPWFFSIHSDT